MTLHVIHYFQENTEQFHGLQYTKKFSDDILNLWTGIAYRLATGWTSGGSKPGGGEIFRTCSHRPWTHPASYTMSRLPGLSQR